MAAVADAGGPEVGVVEAGCEEAQLAQVPP